MRAKNLIRGPPIHGLQPFPRPLVVVQTRLKGRFPKKRFDALCLRGQNVCELNSNSHGVRNVNECCALAAPATGLAYLSIATRDLKHVGSPPSPERIRLEGVWQANEVQGFAKQFAKLGLRNIDQIP